MNGDQSPELHEQFLGEFAELRGNVDELVTYLNSAAIYNTSFIKRRYIEQQSRLHLSLADMMQTIVMHHDLHVTMNGRIEQWKAEANKTTPDGANPDISAEIAELRRKMLQNTNDEQARIESCSKKLAEDAEYVYKIAQAIESGVPKFRRQLGSRWF